MPLAELPPIRITNRMSAAMMRGENLGWHLTKYEVPAHFPRLEEIVEAGKAPLVGVIDTGISFDAIDIAQGKIDPNGIQETVDFTNSRFGAEDRNGHGTHVAGILSAIFGNDMGVSGLFPRLPINVYKALGDDGTGSTAGIARAIRKGVDDGCIALNLSLGSNHPDLELEAAIKYAYDNNVMLFCAAGNSAGAVNYPAKYAVFYPNVFPVTAFDQRERLASFSCRGQVIKDHGMSAPGVDIVSTVLNGAYAEYSGTSMSCPYAMAQVIIARVFGAIKTWTGEAVQEFINESSRDMGIPGRDIEFGRGILQIPVMPAEEDGTGFGFSLGNLRFNFPAQEGDRIGLDWQSNPEEESTMTQADVFSVLSTAAPGSVGQDLVDAMAIGDRFKLIDAIRRAIEFARTIADKIDFDKIADLIQGENARKMWDLATLIGGLFGIEIPAFPFGEVKVASAESLAMIDECVKEAVDKLGEQFAAQFDLASIIAIIKWFLEILASLKG